MNIQFSMSNEEFDIATFCDLFSSTMIYFMWQGTIIALTAWLLACVVLKVTPRVRYAIHLLALGFLFVCPPLTFIWLAQQQVSLASVEVDIVGDSQSKPEDLLVANPDLLVLGTNSVIGSNNTSSVNVIPPNQLDEDHLISASSLSAKPISSTKVSTLAYVATLVYGFGVVGMLIRLFVGVSGSWRLRRTAKQIVDKDLLELLKSQAKRLGLHRLPSFASSSRLTSPVVLGLIRPVVLIPTSMISGMTPADMEAILTHELAHLRRLDLWVNMFQRVAETLLFFHPAVWLVSRRLSADRELCCDDLVLASGQTRVGYASALIRMGEVFDQAEARSAATACAVAGDSPTEFKQRVLRLLEIESPLRPTGSGVLGTSLMSALLFGLAVWSTTLLTPSAALSQEPDLLPIKIIGQVNPRDLLGTVRGFSIDNRQLITSSPDAVTVWNLEDETIDWQYPFEVRQQYLALSSDKRYFATKYFTPDRGEFLIIYDVQSHQEIWRKPHKSLRMVEFSPADNSVFVMEDISSIEIFDINDGTKIGTLSRNGSITESGKIPISIDGRFTAALTNSPVEVIWDLWTGEHTTLPERQKARTVSTMKFVADDQLVCIYSADSDDGRKTVIRIVNVMTNEHRLNLPIEDLPNINYGTPGSSDDGSLLVTTHQNKIVVWNTNDWSRRIVLEVDQEEGLSSYLGEAIVSHDNRYLAVNRGNSLLMWNLTTGESIDPPREKHRGEILDVALSPDESQLVSVGRDGAAFLWNVESGKQIKKLIQINSSTEQAEFIDNTQVLISGAISGSAKREITGIVQSIDVSTGEFLNQLELAGRFFGMSVSEDRQTVAIASGTGRLSMMTEMAMGTGERDETIQTEPNIQVMNTQTFAPSISLLGFQPGFKQGVSLSLGETSVSLVTDSKIHLWNKSKQDPLFTKEIKSIFKNRGNSDQELLHFFGDPVIDSAGDLLYLNGSIDEPNFNDSTFFLVCYDLTSETIKWEVDLGVSGMHRMKLSHNERMLALTSGNSRSGMGDKNVLVIDANSGEKLLQLDAGDGNWISSIEFSSDGNRLYAGRVSGDIAVWDISKLVESLGEQQ